MQSFRPLLNLVNFRIRHFRWAIIGLIVIHLYAAVSVSCATDYHVYYLGGQSNMDGYGYVNQLPDAMRKPVEGVMIFHGNTAADAVAADGRGRWSQLRPGHGVGFESDGKANRYSERFGIELTFANELKELYPDEPVAIVKYSRGGTSIDAAAARHFGCWEPDFEDGQGEGRGVNQYDHFLATVNRAMNVRDIDGDGLEDRLIPAGIVWMQGESDAWKVESAHAYAANLKRLMDLIRAAFRTDDLPVAIGRISDSGNDENDGKVWDFGDVVRKAQQSYCDQDKYATLVTSTDNYGYSDPWHYDTEGYLDLGEKFASAVTSTRPTVSRVLFGSCIKQENPAPILNTIVEQEPDLFVFLGDNIYADTTDMSVMRAKYEKLRSLDGFAALMKACPVLATWDDHDYGANDAGASYPERVASQKMFLDFWGESVDSSRRSREGIYDSAIYGPDGKRVQIILLDTRYFRGELKKGEKRTGGPYYPLDDRSVTMLGEAQWSWLEQQLRKPAELRIIATSIQCIAESSGQETWSNLPRERERLFQLINDTDANGVLLISGDRHWAEISCKLSGVDYPIYDVTSSSLNQIHERGTPTDNRHRTSDTTYHKENYGVIEVDWSLDDPQITIEICGLNGAVQIRKELSLSELAANR